MAIVKNTLIKDNKPVIGALCVLVDKDTEKSVQKTSTNKFGTYRFDNVQPGTYRIEFYGSNCTKDCWVEEIIIPPSDLSGMEPLFFNSEPELNVSEGFSDTDVNGSEYTNAIISISNINIQQGKIVDIVILYKESNDSDYRELCRYKPQLSSLSNITWNKEIYLSKKPVYYDFKAYYYNGNGDLGKVGSTVVESNALNVLFNGIPELYELVAVPGLQATNTNNPTSGELPTNEIDLVWDDLRRLSILDKDKQPSERYFPIQTIDAFGNSNTLTRAQAEKVSGYSVYMFVSEDGNGPTNQHPGQETLYNKVIFDETEWDYVGFSDNGTDNLWVYIGDFSTPNAQGIRCPRGKTVYFWVGAKMIKTETQIQTKRYMY